MRAHALAVVAAVLLALAWGPRPAYADDVADEADLQFHLGADAYQKGNLDGALEHFLASNRLVANRNVMFNIARTYERLQKYPDAFRWYVRAQAGETDATTRDRIEQALRAMAPNVAVLKVETDPPGAKIFLDRKDLGERGSSPQRLGLAPGRYRILAELAGYEDASSAPVDVRLGEEARVSLTLVRILAPCGSRGRRELRSASTPRTLRPPASRLATWPSRRATTRSSSRARAHRPRRPSPTCSRGR